MIDAPQYQAENNAGQAIGSASVLLLWDTVEPELDCTAGVFTLSAGLYIADIEIDFATPDAAWTVTLSANNGGRTNPADGPKPLAVGTDNSSKNLLSQILVRVPEDGDVSFHARFSCDPDAVDPTPLNIDYALLELTPLTPIG